MREVTACPHCGASMQYRRPNGDIACAYCDCIIAMAEERVQVSQKFAPRDFYSGTITLFSPLDYSPRAVWER